MWAFPAVPLRAPGCGLERFGRDHSGREKERRHGVDLVMLEGRGAAGYQHDGLVAGSTARAGIQPHAGVAVDGRR